MAAGAEFELVEVSGDIFTRLVAPDSGEATGGILPGPYQHGAKTVGRYRLEVPGRLDMYRFAAAGADSVRVTSTDNCDSAISFDIAEDVPGLDLSTPHPWCYDFPIEVDPTKRYVLVIWSEEATLEDYELTLERA